MWDPPEKEFPACSCRGKMDCALWERFRPCALGQQTSERDRAQGREGSTEHVLSQATG